MVEGFTLIFVLFGVAAVAVVLFAFWLVISFVRFVVRGFVGIFVPSGPPPLPTDGEYHCPRPGCQSANPPAARFCRRCGREFVNEPAGRRAAMW